MWYFLIPLIVIAVVGLFCLNIKIGFIVGDLTRDTGFGVGFYMMTVVGLISIEASLVAFFCSFY